MKIGVFNFGSKIILDSHKNDRLNNVDYRIETANLIKLLCNNNLFHQFYMMTINDYQDASLDNILPYNLYDAHANNLSSIELDAAVAILRRSDVLLSQSAIDAYNNVRGPLAAILAAPDGSKVYKDVKGLERLPNVVLAHSLPHYVKFEIKPSINYLLSSYLPLETSRAYRCNELAMPYDNGRHINLLIVANGGVMWHGFDKRINIIKKIIYEVAQANSNIEPIIWVGLCNGRQYDELNKININNVAGSESPKGVLEYMRQSKLCLIVPREYGWISSKYVECLLSGCLPIFHSDCGYKCIYNNYKYLDVISNGFELVEVVNYYLEHENERVGKVNNLRRLLVNPYIDGKILSHEIMKILKGKTYV